MAATSLSCYIIVIVVIVIIISHYSSKFAQLITSKNPVATLATLILLSYAKLLKTTIITLSFGVLNYPDGSQQLVWFPDASVKYLTGKHIPLLMRCKVMLIIDKLLTDMRLIQR